MGRIAERRAQTAAVREFGGLPRSTPSAGAAAAGDHGQPTGSGAFEQVVGNASSGSKPLSLDPVGQLRQGLHRPRNRRLSLLPPAFRSGVAYGRGACSAVRHERNCEPQGRSGQNLGSGRRGDLTAPTTEFLLKPRPPQPQRVADHADGGRDMAAAAMIGDNKRRTPGREPRPRSARRPRRNLARSPIVFVIVQETSYARLQ